MVERRGLGVLVALAQAGIGAVEDVEPLGERGHHPVLDPVVHHLHEVPGARLPAVEVAPLLRRRLARAAGRALRGVDARGERGEDRLERGERVVGAADHEAEAAIEAEHAAARAAVEVVDPPLAELGGAADVVPVVGVAAVDDRVARAEERAERARPSSR